MTADVQASTPLVFDPYDYDLQEDPYPTYARMRAEAPLYYNAEQDFWALTRHADISDAVRSEGIYSNRMGVSIDKSAWSQDAWRVTSFLGLDGDEQARLRGLVSRVFTPRRVKDLTPQIEQLRDYYFGRCLEEGRSIEWIEEFAGKLPMDVISELMGVPEEDRIEVRRQADLVVHREDGMRDVPPASMDAAGFLLNYYSNMVKLRRAEPHDDLTSALIEAEVEGDKLSDSEIMAFLFLMMIAGNETTTKLLGNALFHLASNPEQKAQILGGDGDVSMVGPWIEETLRHDTSSQMVARLLLQDVTIGDVTAPAGSKLLLVLGSANRDESVFTDPTVFNINRPRQELANILSFGGGRHFCLGANLARLEAKVVLEDFVRRVKDFELVDEGQARVHSVSVRGFAHLPIRVELRK